MNFDLYKIFVKEQGFPISAFVEAPHLVAELCKKETWTECMKFFNDMYKTEGLEVDAPRKGDGFTALCKL